MIKEPMDHQQQQSCNQTHNPLTFTQSHAAHLQEATSSCWEPTTQHGSSMVAVTA